MVAVTHNDLHPNNSNAQLLKIFTGADSFGYSLKDDILSHIRSSIPNVKIIDLGIDKYYTIASLIGCHVSNSRSSSSITTHSLLFCGTGVGISIFANKHPSVYATLCTSPNDAVNTRSINDCNVLCLSGMSTPHRQRSQDPRRLAQHDLQITLTLSWPTSPSPWLPLLLLLSLCRPSPHTTPQDQATVLKLSPLCLLPVSLLLTQTRAPQTLEPEPLYCPEPHINPEPPFSV